MSFRPDSDGIQQLLDSDGVRQSVLEAAEAGASIVRSEKPDAEVVVDEYRATPRGRFSERPAASITVRDPRARIWQSRDGLLTRAMASLGFEVTEK